MALKIWKRGPLPPADGEVLVSFTAFTAHRWRHLPQIYLDALRLRRGWMSMEGAVGLWLWTQPLRKRQGSVSVWHSEEDLQAFVRTPLHLAVMNRGRDRGTLCAVSWLDRVSTRHAAWQQASARHMNDEAPSA